MDNKSPISWSECSAFTEEHTATLVISVLLHIGLSSLKVHYDFACNIFLSLLHILCRQHISHDGLTVCKNIIYHTEEYFKLMIK